MSTASAFHPLRPRLFGIAYRMTGSVMEAEELVQEAYLRWQGLAHDQIRSADGYLVRIVTRLALDRLKSASAQREQYVGPWLPEPLVVDRAGLEGRVERREAVSTAFLHLLQRLNPVERAVYVLRELFDYEYTAISEIVGRSASACRQIARRARTRVSEGRPRFEPTDDRRDRLTARFFESCATGDMEGLLALLSEEVVAYSDGGGRRTAARRPVVGADHVARFLLGIISHAPDDVRPDFCWLNGTPAVVIWQQEAPYAALTLAFDGDRIVGVYNVLNPDKLRSLVAS